MTQHVDKEKAKQLAKEDTKLNALIVTLDNGEYSYLLGTKLKDGIKVRDIFDDEKDKHTIYSVEDFFNKFENKILAVTSASKNDEILSLGDFIKDRLGVGDVANLIVQDRQSTNEIANSIKSKVTAKKNGIKRNIT